MKTSRTGNKQSLNAFVYAYPGCGKTKFGLDFPYPCIIDCNERRHTTATSLGRDVPVVRVESYEDIRAVVLNSEAMFKEYFPGERIETVIFETATGLQDLLMGEQALAEVRNSSGEIVSPSRPASGIMARPRRVPASERPDVHDFGTMMEQFRDIVDGIREMPQHTIVTAHARLARTEESPKGLIAPSDPKFKDIEYAGYPILIGDLKYNIDGYFDLFLYLDLTKGGDYRIHPTRSSNFRAKTRYAHQLKDTINWTNKNAFELLSALLGQGGSK